MEGTLKLKALFFIALLAGHEAARIRETSRIVGAAKRAASYTPPETAASLGSQPTEDVPEVLSEDKEWATVNHDCHWSTFGGGCYGADNASDACAFRYLPLDWLPPLSSQGCRYTDEYMLRDGNRHKFFKLQTGLLAAKAEKFAAECDDASFANLYCARRAKHMYRSMAYLSKAQESKFTKGLSAEEQKESRQSIEDALAHMKAFAGDNSEYVIKLKEKMQGQGVANLEAVRQVITLLTMLLKGNEEEQQAARDFIDRMVSKPRKLSPAAMEKQQAAIDYLEAHDAEMNEFIENDLNALDNEKEDSAEALGQNSTALIQRGDADVAAVVKGIAFIIIVWLVVSALVSAVFIGLSIVVSFALVLLIGCGAYHAGQNNGQLDFQVTFDCFLQFLTWPVVQGAKGLKWIWEEFAPDEFK
jgi:hypothetical protein